MVLIKVDGTTKDVKAQTLAEMQEAVGGYIEIIAISKTSYMILNEEGKLKGLPVNVLATRLTRGVLGDDDVVVGDVLLAKKDEIN